MNRERVRNEIFEGEPEGRRRIRRTRLRWLEDFEQDLQEMKFERWRQKAVDREKWASAINEAKALGGAQRQEVRVIY